MSIFSPEPKALSAQRQKLVSVNPLDQLKIEVVEKTDTAEGISETIIVNGNSRKQTSPSYSYYTGYSDIVAKNYSQHDLEILFSWRKVYSSYPTEKELTIDSDGLRLPQDIREARIRGVKMEAATQTLQLTVPAREKIYLLKDVRTFYNPKDEYDKTLRTHTLKPFGGLLIEEMHVYSNGTYLGNKGPMHIKTQHTPSEVSSWCFVATAVYQDINHPLVQEFRDFRDSVLSRSKPGRKFINWYYENGPKLAKVVTAVPPLRLAAKSILTPCAKALRTLRQHNFYPSKDAAPK